MRLTLFCLLVFGIVSCCKEYCDGTALMVSFEKFKANDTDTVSFVSYVPATGQTRKVDSFALISPVLPPNARSSVTQTLNSAYDWKIILPSVSKQYLLQDFELTTEKCNCGGKKYKAIRSYLVNGVRKEGLFLAVE